MYKRVMFVGDSLKHYTGFAYVMVSLMKRINVEPENICYVSMTNGGFTHEDLDKFERGLSGKFRDMKIYDSDIEHQEKITNFNQALIDFRPELVITLNDPWRLPIVAYTPFRKSFHWVAYTNIECPGYPRAMVAPSHVTKTKRVSLQDVLSKADLIIPYTDMARDDLLRLHPPERVSEKVFNGIDLLEEKAVTKREVFRGLIPEESFVFFSMGTNSPRKQMDTVIAAFDEFLRTIGNPERYYLMLHSGSGNEYQGPDIIEQITSLGLTRKVILTGADSISPVERDMLDDEYRAIDCYIGLPGAEGFGYGFADAINHRKPVIYIDYGGHREFCSGCGIPVKVKATYMVRNSTIMWALPDIQDAAAAMRRMVSDPKGTGKFIQNAGARRVELDWDRIAERFFRIVNESYMSSPDRDMYGVTRRMI